MEYHAGAADQVDGLPPDRVEHQGLVDAEIGGDRPASPSRLPAGDDRLPYSPRLPAYLVATGSRPFVGHASVTVGTRGGQGVHVLVAVDPGAPQRAVTSQSPSPISSIRHIDGGAVQGVLPRPCLMWSRATRRACHLGVGDLRRSRRPGWTAPHVS